MQQKGPTCELIKFLGEAYKLPEHVKKTIEDQTIDKEDVNKAIFNCLFNDYVHNVKAEPIEEPADYQIDMLKFLATAVLKTF